MTSEPSGFSHAAVHDDLLPVDAAQFRALLKVTQELTFFLNADGRITFVSDADRAERWGLVGAAPGHPLLDAIPHESLVAATQAMSAARQASASQEFVFHASGSVRTRSFRARLAAAESDQ